MSTFNASQSGMWQNLPRDDGGRTMAYLILMACRECPGLGPVVPAEVDNLRRLSQLRIASDQPERLKTSRNSTAVFHLVLDPEHESRYDKNWSLPSICHGCSYVSPRTVHVFINTAIGASRCKTLQRAESSGAKYPSTLEIVTKSVREIGR